MSLPVSPDEEGVMSDNAVPCGTTPSSVNVVSSMSGSEVSENKKGHHGITLRETSRGGQEDG